MIVKTPPDNWIRIEDAYNTVKRTYVASRWKDQYTRMMVLRSVVTDKHGKEWLHLVISRDKFAPDWIDIKTIKNAFIGEDKDGFVLIPKRMDDVNIHPPKLHLWWTPNLISLTGIVTEDGI